MRPAGPVDLGRSPHALLRPLPRARIAAGFWAERQRLNREVLLPEGARRLDAAGNFDNLRIAAGRRAGGFKGLLFLDSDLYKWVEALGWELGRAPSDTLAALADDAIDLIADAQDESGYLNSYYQVAQPGPRFGNLSWDHELYCLGHLIQAAVAHARGRGDERLLGVATSFADHVGERFGPGRQAGVCGHPEVETALIELHRLTGDERHLDLAAYFIDARGHGLLPGARFGRAYWQDHAPVREAPAIVGHAVRALYLAAGATDLHLERGDPALLAAMERWWRDMAGRKAYVTGGVGSHHRDEAFGDPYELPPDRCYGETCAAIASVMWNWRMLLATGDVRHADLMERTLFNGFLAGLALDGSGYSYVNPLQVRAGGVERAVRRPWYPCACCPPNVMRLLASLQHYVATSDGGGLQLHQFAAGGYGGAAGAPAVGVETEFPWDGRVVVEVLDGPDAPWTLSLRVPAWCRTATVACDGAEAAHGPGYARLVRRWRPGDRVVLSLPLEPRLVAAHPRVDAVRGCVAIERGPLVYCLEQADAPPGVLVDDVAIAPAAPLRAVRRDGELGGIVAVAAEGRGGAPEAWPGVSPYAPAAAVAPPGAGAAVTLRAVPYFAWGNRGAGGMRVWIPVAAT